MDSVVPPNTNSWDLFIREHRLLELSGQLKLKFSLIWPFTLFSFSSLVPVFSRGIGSQWLNFS